MQCLVETSQKLENKTQSLVLRVLRRSTNHLQLYSYARMTAQIESEVCIHDT